MNADAEIDPWEKPLQFPDQSCRNDDLSLSQLQSGVGDPDEIDRTSSIAVFIRFLKRSLSLRFLK